MDTMAQALSLDHNSTKNSPTPRGHFQEPTVTGGQIQTFDLGQSVVYIDDTGEPSFPSVLPQQPTMLQQTSKLFSPIAVGSLDLQNRVVMAPMTRGRANAVGGVIADYTYEYYAQ
ncbi:hypothetical protein L198_02943 [Cryptococcus wingfieldii CBS 7118]|uniref:NADH:flavin oxidoreductase/NADH oxidase N-terminal domain-containing protein n=1 Tax=Cryptococcus wingfieldii CBS 7118 TaxID=1295528 RepID=A0A1E3JIH7_9TREE|nr:hypothetical protein L198_02943 [Cryptococcus wingfieldii CBS 7118]ODO00623.1 hypothetical protein L198_02943 [Cryptococcus wingfieldii CBS 7118]